jgi:hypothetical protein
MRAVPIEYLTLDIDREGPPVGYLGGRPIPGTVIDTAGQRYRFADLAPRRPNGENRHRRAQSPRVDQYGRDWSILRTVKLRLPVLTASRARR